MKMRFPCSAFGWGLLACSAAALSGHAQEDDITLDRNRVWISARFAFNISAQVHNLSAPPLSTPPTYDDGYVRPDISGSADGKTWYWGYQEASQVAGDSLNLHIATGSPFTGVTEDLSGDIQAGFELVYGRALGFFNLSAKRQAAWGVLGGFGSTDINIDGQTSLSGTASRREDHFSLGGIVPPVAPYSGTYTGPGPLIGLTPTGSSTQDVSLTTSQYARIDAMALAFKLGPFVELPLGRRFSVNISAGVAVADVLTTFEFSETTTLAASDFGGPPPVRQGRVDDSEWLIGYFANATLSYSLNYTVTVFAGVQYESLGDTTVAVGGKEATLKLGQVMEAQLGIRASF